MTNGTMIAAKTCTEHPDTKLFRMHTHDGYEVFCFLGGKARYYVEGTIYPLHTGDILIMKKAEAHTLLLYKDQPYTRITVNFTADSIEGSAKEKIERFMDERPLGKNNRFPAAIFKDKHWLYYLEELCKSQSEAEKRLYLTVLLSELCDSADRITPAQETVDNMAEVIHYINAHLNTDLSAEALARLFHRSRSHMSRKFRELTGSSMGKYIELKRLLLAKELLSSGINPYRVYEKCGFSEYSTFYRAYKETWGTSPKNDYAKPKP